MKNQILQILQSCPEEYKSGQELAERLECSRAAIWKSIQALQKQGVGIEAVPSKGYHLIPGQDWMTVSGIVEHLQPHFQDRPLTVLSSVDSTNKQLKERANRGEGEQILVAEHQTTGRGRMQRAFFSPQQTGVYFSILLSPKDWQLQDCAQLTTMAAVAACRAIERVCGKEVQIKWVNDLLLNGKKVCGILTEGVLDMENGRLSHAIVGVGMNVYAPQGGFPETLQPIAGYLMEQPEPNIKNRLVAEFLNEFFSFYEGDKQAHAKEYRARSGVLGQEVNLHTASGVKQATVLDIDKDCRLVVQYPDGTQEVFQSGEITLRLSKEE